MKRHSVLATLRIVLCTTLRLYATLVPTDKLYDNYVCISHTLSQSVRSATVVSPPPPPPDKRHTYANGMIIFLNNQCYG